MKADELRVYAMSVQMSREEQAKRVAKEQEEKDRVMYLDVWNTYAKGVFEGMTDSVDEDPTRRSYTLWLNDNDWIEQKDLFFAVVEEALKEKGYGVTYHYREDHEIQDYRDDELPENFGDVAGIVITW